MNQDEINRHLVDKLGEVHERVDEVAATLSPAHLQAAVAAGIREAAVDPEMWAMVILAVRRQAQQEAGGWLFGGVRALFNRMAWVVVIGVGVYLLGGWSALVAMVKSPTVGQ